MAAARRGEAIRQLKPSPGSRVADIGAGTGYFAVPLAHAFGPDGWVYAVDLQREMLDLLREKLDAPDAPKNIEVRQGAATATGLDEHSCELVFLANIWHELDRHEDVLTEAARILALGGRLAILDWRTDVEHPPGPPVEHRISAADAEKMLTNNGWFVSHSGLLGR